MRSGDLGLGAIPPFPPAIPRNLPGSCGIPAEEEEEEDAGQEELGIAGLDQRCRAGGCSPAGCSLGFSSWFQHSGIQAGFSHFPALFGSNLILFSSLLTSHGEYRGGFWGAS